MEKLSLFGTRGWKCLHTEFQFNRVFIQFIGLQITVPKELTFFGLLFLYHSENVSDRSSTPKWAWRKINSDVNQNPS